MAVTDNKLLDGAGVAKLSQLIKEEIAQGGGSSLPTDPSTDGVYKLVNTVETEGGVQTATQSWEEDTGGGGASYTASNGIQIDSNNVIRPGIDINKSLLPMMMFTVLGNNGHTISSTMVNQYYYRANMCQTIDDVKKQLEYGGYFITPYSSSYYSYTWGDVLDVLGLDKTQAYYSGYMSQYSSSSTGYYIQANSNSSININNKPSANKIYFYINNSDGAINNCLFYEVMAGYTESFAIAANGKVDMRNTDLAGERYPTINKALISLQKTRIADTLSSTDTAPSTNNTINWVYK